MTTRTFIRVAMIAGAAAAMAGTARADVFMKVASTPGDASAKGFEEQIALIGASLTIMNTLDYGPDGLANPALRIPQVSPITFNKAPDRSSPKLMRAAIQGSELGTVEITFTSPGRAGHQIDARWILEGAKINSYYTYPGATAAETPTETVEVSYTTMRYQYYVKDAKGMRTGAMEEVAWDTPETPSYGLNDGCG